MQFKRNSPGIAEELKSVEFRVVIHALAEQVADGIRGQQSGADVVVDDYLTDRAASSVTIRDRRARLWQVRDGIFTRAAAAAGLEVRSE